MYQNVSDKSIENQELRFFAVKSGSENEFRVVKLGEKDNIEASLTTFERLMTAYAIAKTKWIFKLAPQLTGKAQQAYAALPTDQALDWLKDVATVEQIKDTVVLEQFLNCLSPTYSYMDQGEEAQVRPGSRSVG